MLSSALLQIKAAFERNKMTPQEIAEDQGLELSAVKAALIQCSTEYRKLCRGEDEEEEEDGLNFSKDQLRDINKVIFECALEAQDSEGNPDYRVRLAAATYIRDDKKGRKEVNRAVQNNTFNVLQLNETLRALRERKAVEA